MQIFPRCGTGPSSDISVQRLDRARKSPLLWALLMKNNPVSRIAIFGFVNPVVNVLLSAVLNGEPLFRWQYLAALVFVCVGIWLVNKAPTKKEEQ